MDGVLTSVHVTEGDDVRQDTQLAKVVDLEFEQQLARVADELRIAEATLQAEIAKVQWQSHVEETEMTKSIAELFESAGRMHDEHGSLDVLRYQLQLNRELHKKQASVEVDLTTFEIQERAKKEELDSIEKAIVVLKQRAERAVTSPRLGAEQIQPMIAKSEMLLNEIARLRERIAQGDLRSPVNGTVLRRHHPAGECVKSHEALFSVMEESSLEIEVFLPQHMSGDYKVGDTVELKIEPFNELVPCKVTAIGAEHRRPPENIEVFYRTNVRLLPIRLKPVGKFADEKKLSVGSVAKLPHFGTLL
jgi:HlyD family secretion protein